VETSARGELEAKWRGWAEQVLGGAPEQIDAAASAAVGILAEGAPQEQAVLAAHAAWAHAVPVVASPAEPGHLRGRVAELNESTETLNGKLWTIWRFTIPRDSEPPVEVEMRAREFEGAIADGDEVDLKARQRRKGPVRVRELENLSSGSTVRVVKPTVRAARASLVGRVVATVGAFAILGGIAAIVVSQL
jgi:hypothetical protein